MLLCVLFRSVKDSAGGSDSGRETVPKGYHRVNAAGENCFESLSSYMPQSIHSLSKTMVCLSVCCSIILFIFMPLSVCLFVCYIILFIFLSLSVCLSVLSFFLSFCHCLSVCRSFYLSFFLSVVLSFCRSFYLLFFLSVVLSIIISVIVCLSVSHLSIVLSVYISSVEHSARLKALDRASLYNLRQQHLHSTCFLRSHLPLVRKRWKIHKNQATHTQT